MIANPNTRIVRQSEQIVGIESPVKGSGLRIWAPTTEDRPLLAAAIPVINGASNGATLADDLRARLVEHGILVHRRQVSAPSLHACALEVVGPAPAADQLVLAAAVRFEPRGGVPILSRDLPARGLDLDGPIAWVEDPVTRIAFPYHVPARWTRALARTLEGAPIAELTAEARAAFHAAGILLSRDDLRAHARRAAAILDRSRAQLATQLATTPFELGIPRLQLRALARHYRALDEQGWFGPSAQAPGRGVIYEEPASMFFHRQCGALASALMGARWKPSYCYLARYRPGAGLPRHVDREQCGLTISIQIELTPARARRAAWPLCVELSAPNKQILRARMLDGEGVAFHGTKLAHWRDPLPARASGTYLFMHFVEESFRGALH